MGSNLSTTAINTAGIRFNRNYNEIVPYFSLLPSSAAQLGIPGQSTNASDQGPPTLHFTNFASLSDAASTLNRNQTQAATESVSWLAGTHSLQFGVGFTRSDLSIQTDLNARGTFNFNGQATSLLSANGSVVNGTGYDMADFLLGFPQSSTIQYTSLTDYFRQNQLSAYAQDEWKVNANLTLILGVRYEYFSPFQEKYGHLTNLDIAPGFTAVHPVTPGAIGPYSGTFPAGLIDPDKNNFSPRAALAWKLPFKKSTVLRAGYGIYYNGQAYQQFTSPMSQQPPFAVTSSVNTSLTNPLTLEGGFLNTSPQQVSNTFAVTAITASRMPARGTSPCSAIWGADTSSKHFIWVRKVRGST